MAATAASCGMIGLDPCVLEPRDVGEIGIGALRLEAFD